MEKSVSDTGFAEEFGTLSCVSVAILWFCGVIGIIPPPVADPKGPAHCAEPPSAAATGGGIIPPPVGWPKAGRCHSHWSSAAATASPSMAL